MIIKLAIRNLFHDRARFLVTLVGILFAVVLVAVQLGMFFGARQMITGMIDHAKGDIWIAAYGAESFEQAPLLTGRERFTALSVPGVEAATPLVASFADWRRPDSSTTNVVVIGAGKSDASLAPWNIVEGNATSPSPDGVIVDRTYAQTLGISGPGDAGEIGGYRVKVEALTNGIRSFTTSPYVFTSLNKARTLLAVPSDQSTFYLVKLAPGASLETVKRELQVRLPGVSVYTKAEFLQRNLDYWLFGTGAGVALLGGALLGLIIGTVIVAQTLYSSTKDHLNEFATLRALGSS
ncbi:MAG: ABC transporter permease, partial [Rhodomicrobium sp.]